MQKRLIRPLAALALILVTGVAGCDSLGSPVAPTFTPSYGRGGGGGGGGGGGSDDPPPTSGWLELITTTVSVTETTVVQVVGKSGGNIQLGPHSLFIPRRAVLEDTQFTLTIVGGDFIHVELSANPYFSWARNSNRCGINMRLENPKINHVKSTYPNSGLSRIAPKLENGFTTV